MFDTIQIIFWGITYLLIIFYSIKNKLRRKVAIPLLPPVLNISWEVNALIVSLGFWGHIVWLILDIFVFLCCVMTLKNRKSRILYSATLVFGFVMFFPLFYVNFGMLLSSFAIDIIMAICFWVERRKLLSDGRIIIAITKLIGDLSAMIYYAPRSEIVLIIGILVFILNVMYLIYALKEWYLMMHTIA